MNIVVAFGLGVLITLLAVWRVLARFGADARRRSEFVSLAAHQLRAPISIINWHLESLISGSVGVTNAKMKQYLAETYEAAARMASLIDSLLSAARIEGGVLVMNPEPTDLATLARGVVAELKPEIEQKKLIVTEQYAVAVPPLMVDAKLVGIVFQNIISNAVKYTPDGGKITISLAVVGPSVRLRVADTGVGIPKSQQGQIFTKLFRAENVKQIGVHGSGLGLYFVKAIVKESGGDISFTSEEHKGTTFVVTLPKKGIGKRAATPLS